MTLKLKRAYEPPEATDGKRYLVDRLWPRGLRRDELRLDAWLKDLAPSTGLRRWFGHEPERWEGFRERYRDELETPEKQAILEDIAKESARGTVTLVFSAKDEARNDAVVVREIIEALAQKDGS